jgi:ADP-heptose:LPS heptosyltransferase
VKLNNLKFIDSLLSSLVKSLPINGKFLSEKPKNILFIKLSAMGDVLCLLPSIRLLSEAFPDAKISLLTTARSQPSLFQDISFIKKIYVLPTNIFKTIIFFPRFFYVLLKFDLVIDCDQYYQISELISYFGRVSIGFKTGIKGTSFGISLPYDSKENEKIQFRRIVELIAAEFDGLPSNFSVVCPELLSKFIPSNKLKKLAVNLASTGLPTIVIFPGSSTNASFRRWDLEKYIYTIKKINPYANIMIVGGPDEVELKQSLNISGLSAIDFINEWTLLELLWIFRNVANLFVGNDGGVLHLAESQGVPIVGIFGPALYSKWGSINSESVPIEAEIDCRPCLRNFEGDVPSACHRGDVACLGMINYEVVADAIFKKIGVIDA